MVNDVDDDAAIVLDVQYTWCFVCAASADNEKW